MLRCCGFIIPVVAVVLLTAAGGDANAAIVGNFSLPDHLGQQRSMVEYSDKRLVVVAFLGTQCPLAKLYAARLQTIANDFANRGVAVVGVMSNTQDSLPEIAEFVKLHDIHYP